jgi:hypothetical protein
VAKWCVRRGNYGLGSRKQSACRASKSRVTHRFPDRRRPSAIAAEVLNAALLLTATLAECNDDPFQVRSYVGGSALWGHLRV